MSITIYHNPQCTISRNTLAMLKASGESPEVVEYLNIPPYRAFSERIESAAAVSHRVNQTTL